jgi:hypothetical protein
MYQTETRISRNASVALAAVFLLGVALSNAAASPVMRAWPVSGDDDTIAVAAGFEGCYATGDSFKDAVEIRDIETNLRRTITRDEIVALVPWLVLSGGQDGISGLAFSDSCRLLFILVYDSTPPQTDMESDVVLRYNTWDNTLRVFAQLNLFDRDDRWPYLAVVHHAGRLYVGTTANGIAVYQASANDVAGVLLGMQELPRRGAVRGLTVDRGGNPPYLYAATATTLFRTPLGEFPLVFTEVGELDAVDIQGITYTRHYGMMGQEGLYLVSTDQVWHVPEAQARNEQPFNPGLYATGMGNGDIAATPDGGLLLGAREDAVLLHDDQDPRLGFWDFVADEFRQAVRFAKTLLSPDGEPSGWVIDANVPLGKRRYHPASPDAAAWVVLTFLMSDRIDKDPEAQDLVRTILLRYAGMADDAIVPERTADGIYRHWYEPSSGGVKDHWDPEWAVLSTAKLVLAAARAQHYYADDSLIQEASKRIIMGVQNWNAYLTEPPACQVYLKGLEAGGPELHSLSSPFNEAILFVEQAQLFGGSSKAGACFEAWLDRSRWPEAEFIAGRPLTGDVPGVFLPAFPSLYAFLLQPGVRARPDWQKQIENLRISSAAWTDDHGPRFSTVFSAGTTKFKWSPTGYHVDNLGAHPGNVAHFPALLGLAAQGDLGPAVAAYHAYRTGARQTFAPGPGGTPEILYRRSNQDPAYEPNSAGLPDVLYGTMALAALLNPNIIDKQLAVATRQYPPATSPAARLAARTP